MTQQIINVGAAINDGTGDPVRTAFTKSNANFTELYAGLGVTDGSNAAVGHVGEYMQSSQAAASAVNCTSAAPTNYIISPVTLTAGDWVIMMYMGFTGSGHTDACLVQASLGLTSSTWNGALGFVGQNGTWPRLSTVSLSCTVGPSRVSLTGSQNYYGLAYVEFTGTVLSAYGTIQAWRNR